jgi:hypothetical protein
MDLEQSPLTCNSSYGNSCTISFHIISLQTYIPHLRAEKTCLRICDVRYIQRKVILPPFLLPAPITCMEITEESGYESHVDKGSHFSESYH